jgi:predicted GNAT family N-acyltransferase
MTEQVEIISVTPSQTLPLRCVVLRPDCPITESTFAGDDDTSTEHWGVFVNDKLVGVASLYQESMPETADANTWRLRGMAVGPAFQGQGYGRQLLDRCLESVAIHSGTVLWCNARTSAVGFYQAAGFEITGNEFVIPGIGPHYVMVCSFHSREDTVAA